MTPELRQAIAKRARDIQERFNGVNIDPVAVAMEAKRVFEDVTDAARCRWLTLELNGYAGQVDAHPLHEVLHVPAGSRLAAHVTAYRTQRGVDNVTRTELRHFFVESLAELAAVRAQVAASSGPPTLVLDFGPQVGGPTSPRSGEFGRDVFDRIILGFFAALHLQLGELVRWG